MEASVLERLTLETGDIEHDDEHSFSRLNIREEEDIVDAIKTRVETGNKADVQAFGISCLQMFIDVNWTGMKIPLVKALNIFTINACMLRSGTRGYAFNETRGNCELFKSAHLHILSSFSYKALKQIYLLSNIITGRTVGEDNLSWINSEQISTLEDHLGKNY